MAMGSILNQTSSALPLSNGVYDAGNKRIVNVADPVDDGDAVSKGYLRERDGGYEQYKREHLGSCTITPTTAQAQVIVPAYSYSLLNFAGLYLHIGAQTSEVAGGDTTITSSSTQSRRNSWELGNLYSVPGKINYNFIFLFVGRSAWTDTYQFYFLNVDSVNAPATVPQYDTNILFMAGSSTSTLTVNSSLNSTDTTATSTFDFYLF